jgi:hypothetical protein
MSTCRTPCAFTTALTTAGARLAVALDAERVGGARHVMKVAMAAGRPRAESRSHERAAGELAIPCTEPTLNLPFEQSRVHRAAEIVDDDVALYRCSAST